MFRLYLRLFGATLLLLLFSTAIMLAAEQAIIAQFYTGKLRDRFHPIFNLTAEMLKGTPEAGWTARLAEIEPLITAPVSDKYRLSLATLSQAAGRWDLNSAARDGLAAGDILYFETEEQQAVAVRRLGMSDYALELWLPGLTPMKHVSTIVYLAVQIILAALLIGLWVGPFWRDLSRANQAAARVGGGDFGARLDLKRSSALSPLSEAFNSMTARINELLTTHRELTTSVSHELRNPLMRLRFRHSLARDASSGEEVQRHLGEMEGALDELDHLVDEILTYARVKNPGKDMRFDPVEAKEWAAPLLEVARQLVAAGERNIALHARIDVEELEIEPVYMGRALSNLLSNATRFANRQIDVVLRREGGSYMLSVEDDGPGVPAADRENVFEPFWRGDQSRSRKTGGFGIGLALVRRIAQWHGGQATVESSSLGGARFVLRWPVKEAA